ncbi:MAG: response regulator transcription factor [bacterium]|nr:response regulator transcription factor [bacterium]
MRILIVEDDEALAKALKKGLKKEGYAVDYLSDSDTAERRISLCRDDYDVFIFDIMLPKGDGFSLCRFTREKKIQTPILMLTGKDQIVDKVAAFSSGADDYLVKPFSFEELTARIKALLRRPKQVVAVELSVRGLGLNSVTREVTYNGKLIKDLTVKEFALLEHLMRHANQVLSRNQILDHLWGFDFDSFSNVLDVHIKNLRKKINDNDHKKLLETVRGVGYRIRA